MQEIFSDEVTLKASSHSSDEAQDVLKVVAVLEACSDAVLRAQPPHMESLVESH